jgi:5-methyltetrahydropteroyltriglutamate--homocysteine methyltransferase
MALKFPALATTHVGSMPRPRWMGETDRNRVTFRLEGKALDEAQDDATIVTLREQEALGVDIVTDGEQRREGFIFHMCRTWDGIDLVNQVQKDVYRRRNTARMVPHVTGKLKRRSAATVDDVRFAKAYTGQPVKMALAGPMTVIDSSLNDAYADEGEMAMDIAAAVNAELLDLQAAGCDLLQLDEPAMTRYHEKVFDYGAAALDRCLEGVTVPVIVHLCYGYPGGASLQHQYTYPELLDRLMETRIAGFTVEFGRSTYDPAILKPYRERLFMFGCIDPGNTPAPTVDDVKRRVAGALDYLDPAKVMLSPDCGLMTISRELARDKLKVMVAQLLHLRREAALASDPLFHRRGVIRHQVVGAGVARHLHAERIGLVVVGGMEAEAGLGGHADLVQRHDPEHQRAGRIADAVDDDALAAVANLRVFRFVLLDQPAEIARDAVIRMRNGHAREHEQGRHEKPQQLIPPEIPTTM